jgi:hypothetical protein
VSFRRFSTLGEAIRFVLEEATEGVRNVVIEAGDLRLGEHDIRQLYESEFYPIERRRKPGRSTPRHSGRERAR